MVAPVGQWGNGFCGKIFMGKSNKFGRQHGEWRRENRVRSKTKLVSAGGRTFSCACGLR